jgi:hypothetical protein
MKDKSKKDGTKKGFWATIRESMTKTGGCCGSGESCCGPAKLDAEKKRGEEDPPARNPDATGTSRS